MTGGEGEATPARFCRGKRGRVLSFCWNLGLFPIDFCKQIVYAFHVITTFANKETEKIFATGKSRKLPPEIIARAIMRLTQLDSVREVTDLLMPPSNRLEALSGNRAGQWSIRINEQWRICFSFANGEATEVEITDYH